MADFTVTFDGYDLNLIPNLEFVRRYPNNEADIQLNTHDLIRRDGAVLTSTRHGSKVIALEGYITALARSDYEIALDTLKVKTSGIEKRLVLVQAGAERKYVATKENLVEEHIEAGKSRINLAFRCSDPYGKDTTLTVDTETATAATSGLTHVFLGTAVARPTFTVTINSLTGGTNKHVGIGNSQTGQQVQVQRTWTAGDVVIFNMNTKNVYVNGTIVDYSGVFPTYQPNTTSAYYYDDLTTRNATVVIAYEKQYL